MKWYVYFTSTFKKNGCKPTHMHKKDTLFHYIVSYTWRQHMLWQQKAGYQFILWSRNSKQRWSAVLQLIAFGMLSVKTQRHVYMKVKKTHILKSWRIVAIVARAHAGPCIVLVERLEGYVQVFVDVLGARTATKLNGRESETTVIELLWLDHATARSHAV